MVPATRGSSAYKLQPPVVTRRKKTNYEATSAKARKTRQHSRPGHAKTIFYIIVGFALALTLCTRWVSIYGLHNDILRQTAELERLQMTNEQLTVEIDTMTDSSKIEKYAQEELGMRKLESSQIVYIRPTQHDAMQKVAKKNAVSSRRGIFGMFSPSADGKTEYLR